MKKLMLSTLLLGTMTLFINCGQPSQQQNQSTAPETNTESDNKLRGQAGVVDDESEMNILKVALGSPDHTTLVAAVQAAEMEHVLVNAGPLTVFAPTNDAFEKLPPGTVEDLLKPENKSTLANIITYHAAPGTYDDKNIKGVMGIGQATGDRVKVEEENGEIFVNGNKVLASIKASNGYVHVIDGVLLPPE